MGRNGYTRQTYNARLLYRRRVVLGNKQLTDNFKVLEQRQKSLDVPRPLAQGRNNRSMQNLISSDEATSKKDEEAPAIIVFVVGGMTYSEIRSVDIDRVTFSTDFFYSRNWFEIENNILSHGQAT